LPHALSLPIRRAFIPESFWAIRYPSDYNLLSFKAESS
jgi:hypothetical protein